MNKTVINVATKEVTVVEMTEDEINALGQEALTEFPVKFWLNSEQFMREFTLEEKGAIALSQNVYVAALRLELSTWFSAVKADDPRVIGGLDALVAADIISEERKNQILFDQPE